MVSVRITARARGRRRTRRQRSRLPMEVYVLAAVHVCIGIGYGVAAPIIPVLAKTFDTSDFLASMVVSVYAAARVVVAPFSARLALRFRPGILMSWAMVFTAVTSFMAAISGSFAGLLFWRGLSGASTALSTVAAQALLYKVAPAGSRGRATAVFHTGFLVGGVIGPVLGGVVAEVDLAAPLVLYAVLILLGAATAGWTLRRRTVDGEPIVETPQGRMSWSEALADVRYRTVLIVQFGHAWIANGVRFTVVPLFVAIALGLSPVWTGLGLLLSALTQLLLVLPGGVITDRRGPRAALILGSALAVAASVMLVVVPVAEMYLVSMAVYGVSSALLTPASGALLGDVLDGRGGPPLAGFQMVFDVATILAPLLCGLLSDAVGFGAAFGVTAAVAAVSLLAAFMSPRVPAPSPETRPVPPQPE